MIAGHRNCNQKFSPVGEHFWFPLLRPLIFIPFYKHSFTTLLFIKFLLNYIVLLIKCFNKLTISLLNYLLKSLSQ